MKKGLILIITIVCAGLFLTSGILSAANIPETIVIDGQSYAKNKMGPVNFNHKIHFKDYKVKCTDCHHEYVEGKNVWKANKPAKKCGECHDPAKSEGNVKKLMMAFHNNCQGCHKEKISAGEEIQAPTKKCTECHQK